MQSDETVLTPYSDNTDEIKRNLHHSYHHQ